MLGEKKYFPPFRMMKTPIEIDLSGSMGSIKKNTVRMSICGRFVEIKVAGKKSVNAPQG